MQEGWEVQRDDAPATSRWPVGDSVLFRARDAEVQLARALCSDTLVTLILHFDNYSSARGGEYVAIEHSNVTFEFSGAAVRNISTKTCFGYPVAREVCTDPIFAKSFCLTDGRHDVSYSGLAGGSWEVVNDEGVLLIGGVGESASAELHIPADQPAVPLHLLKYRFLGFGAEGLLHIPESTAHRSIQTSVVVKSKADIQWLAAESGSYDTLVVGSTIGANDAWRPLSESPDPEHDHLVLCQVGGCLDAAATNSSQSNGPARQYIGPPQIRLDSHVGFEILLSVAASLVEHACADMAACEYRAEELGFDWRGSGSWPDRDPGCHVEIRIYPGGPGRHNRVIWNTNGGGVAHTTDREPLSCSSLLAGHTEAPVGWLRGPEGESECRSDSPRSNHRLPY